MSKTKHQIQMRKLCPNFDREDALETILEVPIPEEMFTSMGSNVALRWQNMATWMKAQTMDKWSSPIIATRYNELSFLLYMIGSPLIPLQVQLDHSIHRPVKHSSIVRYSTFFTFFLKKNYCLAESCNSICSIYLLHTLIFCLFIWRMTNVFGLHDIH